MGTHNFEQLDVWKRGCQLAVDVCLATNDSKLYSLKDQIQRSVVSIPSNVAEGAERRSPADFRRFLNYSAGSCGELRTQLHIFQQLNQRIGASSQEPFDNYINETRELSRMLQGLISRIEEDASK